ncbi:MAG: TetR/AcrR family transcriptional regulator [Phycisphaerales bacterium]|nr:TetR/AcrR family transcriptional regulator [Phycisphaerales bacterium]MCI0677341.1 TetR/AcrR family transcriptional regulator [Phycisphaerales bacterium]
MPWKKQFDVEAAREKAQAMFWEKGYEATSMDDLLIGMGINRGSFYDTFGSKQELYTETLRQYDLVHRRTMLLHLERDLGPRDRILALFEGVRQAACGRKGKRGCFLTNATVEFAGSNSAVAKVVRTAIEEIERFFCSAIEDGQARKVIRTDIDARVTARTLLGMLLGMRVLARSGASPEVLGSIAQQVKQMI